MWVLEELGSCWQAGRQLALATEAWAVERGDLEDSSLAPGSRGSQRGSHEAARLPPPLGLSGGHRGWVSLRLLFCLDETGRGGIESNFRTLCAGKPSVPVLG